MYACVSTCMCVCVCTIVCICVYVCKCSCMYNVCMYECTHGQVFMHV